MNNFICFGAAIIKKIKTIQLYTSVFIFSTSVEF